MGKSLDLKENANEFFNLFSRLTNTENLAIYVLNGENKDLVLKFPTSELTFDSEIYTSQYQNLFLTPHEFIQVNDGNIWAFKTKSTIVFFQETSESAGFYPYISERLTSIFLNFINGIQSSLNHQSLLNKIITINETDHRRFEREAMFRFGANSLTEGIIVTDLDDRITYVNRAMEDITGFSREELYESIAHQLFRPVGFENFIEEKINKKRLQDISETYEVEQLKKNGSTYWVKIRASAFKDYTGKIIGTIASMVDITESITSKKAIETARKELKDVLDNIYDGLLIISDKGIILEANPSAIELFELDIKQIGKVRLKDLVHPDNKNDVDKNRDIVITNGALSTFESKIITPTGTTKTVEVSSSAIVENGQYLGSRDVVRDITVKKELEKERIASEKKLKLIIDTALDAVVTMDTEGLITEWNQNAERIFGYTYDEVLGQQLSEYIIPKQYREAHANGMRKYFESGEGPVLNVRIEISAINKKEEEFPIELAITPVTQDGKTFFSAFIRDISERKRLEKQRELSETKLKLIVDTALDAVVTMNSEGNITEWNQNAVTIFGFERETVLNKKLSDFIIPHQYREAHARGMKHYFASGEGPVLNKRIEITAIDNMEREFPIELAITPVKQENGTFFSAFIRDISSRKEIEAQKEMLLSELESVNKELKDFAYIVSHDLKAPLRSISSLTDWLVQDYEETLDEEGKDLLNLLKTRTMRMHSLIDGVLKYSKVSRQKSEKDTIDLNELLAEIVDLLDPPKNCKIIISENLPTVQYDKVRLHQVFQNLLSNAIKFLDKPEGEILVDFSETDTHYKFKIKDNGPGIEEDSLEKIFQIFQTLGKKDEYENTGIGLSIVKRIVELNKGTISVSSVINKGTEFSFTVPK
ncbi:MAG: PAS domain-containing sensor histidine kinase [Bacteroidia bacterium]